MSLTKKINVSELSILLVEPSKTQQKVIANHLNVESIAHIEVAGTGKETLDLIQTRIPDMIISSLYLPDMNALDLVKQVKNNAISKDIPVMIISSETRFDALDPIRQAGVIAILPKPFNQDDLKRALRTSIDYIDPEEVMLENYDIESIRVLVVDDSTMARKHISRVLKSMGIIHITEAHDGKHGVEVFSQSDEAFDLIVTDYNMPEMDGRELIEYIRTKLDNPFIPILMVTSEDNESRLNNIQQAGVSGICDKPFEPQTVKELLFRVFDES